MSGCCSNNSCELEVLRERQSTTLKIVLLVNVLMFIVVAGAAAYAGSSALLSDSLDNLGDALTYGLSLYVVTRNAHMKARVALFKGVLIFLAAMGVAGQITYKFIHPAVPVFETMGIFSLLSLAANAFCLYLLWRHREEDLNMSSVWECSRNDIAVNISVFIAAGGVWLTKSAWPDILVASGLILLLLRSAFRIISNALNGLHGAA